MGHWDDTNWGHTLPPIVKDTSILSTVDTAPCYVIWSKGYALMSWRKCRHDMVQSSVGLLSTRSLSPHFFDYRKQPSVSLHDLPWAPMGRFKPLLIREEGNGRPGRSKQSRAALEQSPISPSKDTHNNIFKLFCKYWNPLQVGEVNDSWRYAAHKHIDSD